MEGRRYRPARGGGLLLVLPSPSQRAVLLLTAAESLVRTAYSVLVQCAVEVHSPSPRRASGPVSRCARQDWVRSQRCFFSRMPAASRHALLDESLIASTDSITQAVQALMSWQAGRPLGVCLSSNTLCPRSPCLILTRGKLPPIGGYHPGNTRNC